MLLPLDGKIQPSALRVTRGPVGDASDGFNAGPSGAVSGGCLGE